MSRLLTKLGIFRARYPETASAILALLTEKPSALRRGITAALPAETSACAIRESLADLMDIGLIKLSPEKKLSPGAPREIYCVPCAGPHVQDGKQHSRPAQPEKRHYCIRRFQRVRRDRAQFLKPVRRLIERGLVEFHDVPLAPLSTSYRRHYTFKNPE